MFTSSFDISCKVVARLRSTPLLTTTCDLHQPIVLPHLTLGRPPNIIIVKLCLEFAATSAQQVRTMIKGLADMIGETVSETTSYLEVCKYARMVSFIKGSLRVSGQWKICT